MSQHASHSSSATPPGSWTRRRWLQSATAGVLAGAGCSLHAAPGDRPNPSDRITVGVVGLGSRGFNLIDDLLAEPDAEIVALCDVDEEHHRDRPWGQGPLFGRRGGQEKVRAAMRRRSKGDARPVDVCSDFRKLCARDDLDAVIVATPDHWHALCTLTALQHGKDVYCEKPVTHTFAEGLAVCEEAARRKAVVQVGSQQRSAPEFRRVVELARAGLLGSIQRVEVGLPPGYEAPMGDPTEARPPESLDYDAWCGPAPQLPYMRARHHRW